MQKKVFQERLFESLRQFATNPAVEYGSKIMTYAELDKSSHRLALWILERGISTGTFFGILTENRLELVTILIGVMKAGCVIVPLYPGYPTKRIEEMILATDLEYIVCDEYNARRFAGFQAAGGKRPEFIVHAEIYKYKEEQESGRNGRLEFGDVVYDPEDPLYIHFTSGTTGVPRAIVGKNKSLLHFLNWEIETFAVDSGYRVAQFSIPGFDPMLRDIFAAFFAGGVVCIPENKDIVLVAEELKDWVDQQGIALIHCVSSQFRLLSSGSLHTGLFKDLKYIIMAGEKINPADLRRWYETFTERIRLVNCYGTSETTMFKTCYLIRQSDVNRERVPVGKPIKGARIIILDEQMNICEELVPGEIYIRTPYMSCGYYNDPRANQERFIPNPFSGKPEDLLHKTGDRGMFLSDGNLEFLGRLDRQVNIRGNRIEPGEIESVLMQHPAVGEAVVTMKEVGNNELLAAYVVGNGGSTAGEIPLLLSLDEFLKESLPAYMIPANIVELPGIPRNAHGKIDYSALPDPLGEEEDDFVLPRDDTERRLSRIWGDILGLNNISINSNFFKIGGNSLNLMTLTYRVHKAFGVRIPLSEIFKNSTISQQARLVRRGERTEFAGIRPAGKKSYYVLSAAQKRMYILNGLEPAAVNYNLPMVVMLTGSIDIEQMAGAFKKIIDRHESLRTGFELTAGNPVQKIYESLDIDFEIEYYDTGENQEARGNKEKQENRPVGDAYMKPNPDVGARRAVPGEFPSSGGVAAGRGGLETITDHRDLVNRFIRPFDLSRAPLIRAGLISITGRKYFLMVDMHHIISDGTSLELFKKEFMALYAGEELPPLSIQYKDYAEWQNSAEQKEKISSQEDYWVKQFAGGVPVLDLPSDYPRPAIKSYAGNTLSFEVNKEETTTLNKMAVEMGTTMYTVLLAIYYVFLAKMSGQEDIVIGTPTAGRLHADLEPIIGMFVNTLGLRNYPGKEKSFREFLQEVKTRTLAAFENQDYQFEELVEKLDVKRDTSRSPLFDVMFALQNMVMVEIGIPGLKLTPYEYENKTSKFDMILVGFAVEDRLRFVLEYSSQLFKKDKIDRYIGYFKDIITVVLKNMDIKMNDINVAGHLIAPKPEISQEIRGDFDF